MTDSTVVFDDLEAVGIEYDGATTITGRINHTQPRIAIISGPGSKTAAAIAASMFPQKYTLVDVDYSEIEGRALGQIMSDGVLTGEELLKMDMENVYKYQVQSAEQLDRFMKDPYGVREGRERGQVRKNGHRSSYVAKDHRSATKRQRSARKKNRKK